MWYSHLPSSFLKHGREKESIYKKKKRLAKSVKIKKKIKLSENSRIYICSIYAVGLLNISRCIIRNISINYPKGKIRIHTIWKLLCEFRSDIGEKIIFFSLFINYLLEKKIIYTYCFSWNSTNFSQILSVLSVKSIYHFYWRN